MIAINETNEMLISPIGVDAATEPAPNTIPAQRNKLSVVSMRSVLGISVHPAFVFNHERGGLTWQGTGCSTDTSLGYVGSIAITLSEMDWSERVDDDTEADLVRWRRYLHEHPELSFEEFETTKYVASMLDEWGIPYDRPMPTGLVAHVHGKHPGPTVAYRCDLDALPIEEENTFEFRSRTAGKMHACGHDGHTAILLGLARTLNDLRDEIHGEVRLLFQPAEEVGASGAKHLIATGALEGVQAVIGLHLASNLETGLISLTKGPIMAAADTIEIIVTGYGGHGGYPHEAIDPLMIAAGLIGHLQTIVSRRVSPMDPAVVSIGSFHAGSAPNIIPGSATLTGTVRTLSEKVRAKIAGDITTMAETYARAHGGTAEVNYQWGSPACVNDGRMVDFLLPAAAGAVGSSSVLALPPEMGGEDFAYYAQVAPTAFALIGSGNKKLESDFPHHHPRFTIDERALGVGLRFMLQSVERTSAGQATLPSD